MENKFQRALKQSFDDLKKVNHDINSINILIENVANAVEYLSDNKVTLVAVDKFAGLSSFLLGFKKVSEGTVANSSSEIEKLIQLEPKNNIVGSPSNSNVVLTTLKHSKKGFPCSVIINGDVCIAQDIETLEDYFVDLLSDVETSKAIKSLVNKTNL